MNMVGKGWEITQYESGHIVVLPVNDKRPHDAFNPGCLCNPEITEINGNIIVTHNAFDFRDVEEELNNLEEEDCD